jgi:hypothetical protein
MKIPRLMAIAIVLLASLGVGAAQTSDKCQIVSVEAPAKEVDAGISIVFSARLNTIVPTAKPEFKWQISAGTITAGEGTSSITVDTAGLGGQLIEATVSVSGVPTTCSTSATQSVAILITGPNCGLAFDELGDIGFEDENARLDNFAIQLITNKEGRGSIIIFAARKTYENEARERLDRAKDYLVKVRKIDPNRVITVDGGYREDFTIYFYIIPPGVDPPAIEGDVSRTEIELTKPRPKPLSRKHR